MVFQTSSKRFTQPDADKNNSYVRVVVVFILLMLGAPKIVYRVASSSMMFDNKQLHNLYSILEILILFSTHTTLYYMLCAGKF